MILTTERSELTEKAGFSDSLKPRVPDFEEDAERAIDITMNSICRTCSPTLILLIICRFFVLVPFLRADERPEIKIGVILPLTGGMAHVGASFRDAAKMALEDLKEKTRFNYKLIFEDDALTSNKAALAANKLLRIDNVDAIVSTWSYGGSVVAPMAEQAKKIHFGVAWDATIAQGRFNFLHLTPPLEFISKILDGYQKLGFKKIASFGVTESGSIFALDELERIGRERGFSIVDRTVFSFSDNDMRSALLKSEQRNPDVLYVNLAAPQIDLFIKQLIELKISTPVVAMTGFDVANDLGEIEGKWYVSDSWASTDFTDRFVTQYHHKQVYGAGNYYDIVKLLAFLFEQSSTAKKPSSEELLTFTSDLSKYGSIFGTLKLDPEGIVTYPAQYLKIVDGKRVPISLDEVR